MLSLVRPVFEALVLKLEKWKLVLQNHAEETMLSKFSKPSHPVIYTLESCLVPASKYESWAQRLGDAGGHRIIYVLAEDVIFTRQSGLTRLRKCGIELLHLSGYEEGFRVVNGPIYDPS